MPKDLFVKGVASWYGTGVAELLGRRDEVDEDLKPEYETYLGLQPDMSAEQLAALHQLIRAYNNSSSSPISWDFAGGFHFAATIVSTIGESFIFLITAQPIVTVPHPF